MTDSKPTLLPFAHAVEQIVSAYERDEISYDAAHQKIIDASSEASGTALYWAELDLWCAKGLKEDESS